MGVAMVGMRDVHIGSGGFMVLANGIVLVLWPFRWRCNGTNLPLTFFLGSRSFFRRPILAFHLRPCTTTRGEWVSVARESDNPNLEYFFGFNRRKPRASRSPQLGGLPIFI